MSFEYTEIERVKTITKEEFIHNYYKPQKPLVIEEGFLDWPAYKKWDLDYIKNIAGDKIVPLYDNEPVDADKKVNEPVAKMRMDEYIELLRKGPTDLRIFLYSILKEVPALREDFKIPDFGVKILKGLPMLFFGGEGSNVFMHYDIDFANIFHFHFAGKKQCVLVEPKYTKYMYKQPFAWICREDIDFDNPDFEKFPALKKVKPLVANLEHGQMLFMPEGYWHYMKYITPSFSMSLRAIPHKPKNLLQAINNVFIIRNFDNLMRKWKGNKWLEYKDRKAMENTNKNL